MALHLLNAADGPHTLLVKLDKVLGVVVPRPTPKVCLLLGVEPEGAE